MKKLYSTIMLLAMMVAALGLASCSSDDDNVGGSSSLVGTWKATDLKGWDVLDKYGTWTGDYFQLKSDGTFLRVSSNHAKYYGDWKLSDNVLTLHYTDDALLGSRISYDVISQEQDSMVLAVWGLKIYCKRVPDDDINTYLNNKR